MDEIKLDIEEQITKTNKTFINYWGKLAYDGLLDNEIETLEIALKKIVRQFKGFKIGSIVSSVFLITVSMLAYFDILILVNMNHMGLMILITISCLTSTYRFYKLKVNIEYKIYLLSLLSKIKK